MINPSPVRQQRSPADGGGEFGYLLAGEIRRLPEGADSMLDGSRALP